MTRKTSVVIHIDESLCKGVEGCGLCIHVCPRQVYDRAERLTDKGRRPPDPVRLEDCTDCGLCMMFCPDLAIVVDSGE